MAFLPVLALTVVCVQAPTGQEIARNLSARAAQDEASTLIAHYRKEWKEEVPVDPNVPPDTSPDDIEWQMTKQRVWAVTGNGYRFTQTVIEDSTGERAANFQETKLSDARRTFVARYDFKSETPCAAYENGLLVIDFSPRTDTELPNGEREDDLLNHLSGTMYIDTERWYVRRAVGKLARPFRIKLLGKVTDARVWLEQDDDDGVVILRNISTEIWAEYRLWPFDKKHLHFRQIYQFFRQPTETTPQVSPLP